METPARNYTAVDIPDFLSDVGYGDGPFMYARVKPLLDLKDLGGELEIHPRYGVKVDTPERFIYDGEDWDEAKEVVNGDGDGTVNARSLRAVNAFKNAEYKEFEGQTHTGLLKHQPLIDELVQFALK